MPIIDISPEERVAGRAGVEAELEAIFEECMVDDYVIALLGHFGVKRLRTFAKIAGTEAQVRSWLQTDLGIVETDSTTARVKVAKILDAWEVAVKRREAWGEADAARRVTGVPKEVPKSTFMQMRQSHQQIHGKLLDSRFPAKQYVEWRLDQFDDGELKAEKLTETLALTEVAEGETPVGHAYFDKDGRLRERTRLPKIAAPGSDE